MLASESNQLPGGWTSWVCISGGGHRTLQTQWLRGNFQEWWTESKVRQPNEQEQVAGVRNCSVSEEQKWAHLHLPGVREYREQLSSLVQDPLPSGFSGSKVYVLRKPMRLRCSISHTSPHGARSLQLLPSPLPKNSGSLNNCYYYYYYLHFMYLHIWIWVCTSRSVCECERSYLQKPKKGIKFPGDGVTGS